MIIKRNGIVRNVSKEQFEKVFKKQGYMLIEKVEEKEITKAEIIAKLQELGIEHNPRLRKDELMALL
jgi:hypothetical protein